MGRLGELSVLEAALARAAAGDGSLVLVSGDSGVGKSRLVAEAAARARAAGAVVIVGECPDLANGELPYAPITGALRSLARERGAEEIGSFLGAAGEALGLYAPDIVQGAAAGGRPPAGFAEREGAQVRLFTRLLTAFAAIAQDSPFVLVVEDLQWADRSTRDFISFLAASLRRERLVVVATYRSDELHRRHLRRRFVRGLVRSGTVTRIELQPFSRAELGEQAAEILGTVPGPDLIDRLLERSEGNPFFAEELLAASLSADAVLPESLRDALLLRVEALPLDAQVVSRVVAVAARPIGEPLLTVVAGLAPDKLTEGLRAAVDHHVLRHDPGSAGYAFRHALLREAVYADLLPGERHALHMRLAEALAGQPDVTATRATVAAELAYHWRAAHQLAKALPASIRAGMEAEAVHASAGALAHYEQSLRDWESAGLSQEALPLPRAEVARRAAEAADLSGEPDRAIALGRLALVLTGETGDPVATALAHERLGRYLWVSGRGKDALPEYRRAVELMPASPPSPERALVLAAYGQVLCLCDRPAESLSYCQDAIRLAREVGAAHVEAHALNTIGTAWSCTGDHEADVQACARARAIAARFGLVQELGRGYVNGSDALDQAGRIDEAIALAREGLESMRAAGADRRYGDFLRAEIAGRLLRSARWAEAETLLADLTAGQPTGINAAIIYLHLGELRAERGELEAASRVLERARQIVTRAGGSMWLGPVYAARASVQLWERRPQAAADTVQEGLGLVEGTEYLFFTSRLYDLGARAGADLVLNTLDGREQRERELARGQSLLGRLDSLAGPFRVLSPLVAASRAACVAELSRITDPDPGAWARAQRAWEACGDRYQAAYARWRQAEALLAGSGDRAAAARAVGEAYAVAAELGARPLAGEIEALARRARLTPIAGEQEQAPAQADVVLGRLGLTPREIGVLVLLAEGRTNREIAASLFISDKTASAHVSRILAKLQVSNRSAAAAVAHRLGLTAGVPERPV